MSDFPERLPQGEHVLWQGRPSWRALARRGFHLNKLAVYFAVLLAWYGVNAGQSQPWPAAALGTLYMTGLALVPLALVVLYAWVTSRMALYTVTDRRVVMRVGIAMPITFNIPFNRIEAASLRAYPDGHGDVVLTLSPTERMAYLVVWPHARPWRMARTEPMLRCVPDAALVARIAGQALAASANVPSLDLPVDAAAAAPIRAGRRRATALA